MRSRRIKVRAGEAYYHCISRTVAGAFLFDDRDKEHFRLLMHRVAAFCGLEIVAYAVLSNHFHILVRVPDPAGEGARPGDRELLRRLGLMYPGRAEWLAEQARILAQKGSAGDWLRRALWSRMGDVSAFMKELKQLYSRWYNRQHGRFGTLWAERFKSILVEPNPKVLRILAAYIDLNPVRAGLCKDPAEYRFCSYAEAVAGGLGMRTSLAAAFGGGSWAEVRERYREYLFGRGLRQGSGIGAGFTREQWAEVMAAGGKIETPELLRFRLKFLADGRILGSEEFVRSQADAAAEDIARIRERKRRTGPARILLSESGASIGILTGAGTGNASAAGVDTEALAILNPGRGKFSLAGLKSA